MQLFTKEIEKKLRANHQKQKPVQGTEGEIDFKPVLKCFTPDGGATWLFTELHDDGDTLFGLCDLGLGCVELGYVSLAELKSLRGKLGLPVERDRWFTANKTLNEYTGESSKQGRIAA